MGVFLQILGALADVLGVTGFFKSRGNDDAIKKIKNRIVNKQIVSQFNRERNQVVAQIKLFINLLITKDYSDKSKLYMELTTLLSQIEYYKDVILNDAFKKIIKETIDAKNKENDQKIVSGLAKIQKIFERSLKNYE